MFGNHSNPILMKSVLLVVAVLFLVVAGISQKPLPPNLFTKKLPNGLEILVLEDNSVPLATIEIAVKNGSFTEAPEFNGLSHLYEHMFFKTNKKYSGSMALVDRMQELGISHNGSTTDERVNYYFTLPRYNLKAGLELMNDAIRYPSFKEADMQKENEIVDAEFQRAESNPLFALSDAMDHHVWGDLYSRKHTIGDHAIIRSATPGKMQAIRDKYYWPNNSLLIVAGDVNHEEVFVQAESFFGDWKPSKFDPFVAYPVPEFKPLEKTDYFIVESPNAKVPTLRFTWQGPDTRRDIPNTYVADIFSYVLLQNSSKFHKALVESGLALELNVNYGTKKYTGPISFSIVPNPGKIKECVEAFNAQLNLLDADDYITDEQLAISKRQYEIRQIREEEVTSQFTHTLAYWWCSASIDYFNTYLDNLNKVTKQDIQNYVRKYIKGQPHCAGLLISPDDKVKINPETFFRAD